MNRTAARATFAILVGAVVLASQAHAQSSLGIGTNEATLPSTGLFASFFNTINAYQQEFYRSLTGALKEMRNDGGKLWVLIGLSFAYGIFHAAGPGHGKAVISSYMLANEVALRRGIMLAFVSAFLQALTAIVVMALVFLVLRGTAISMTDATWFLEIASYALISCFGAWLLWKKAGPLLRRRFGGRTAHSLSAAHAHSPHAHAHHDHAHHHHGPAHGRHTQQPHDHAGHDHDHGPHALNGHDHGLLPAAATTMAALTPRSLGHGHAHDHDHTHDHGADCGHLHAPDPAMLSGDRFDWRTAWSAVAAVGLRPCSGALIVLTFAFLNGLWAGGIMSVVAMAVGTGITVAILATIAVTAKNVAVRLAGADGRVGSRIHTAIEIGGAVMVLVIGLTLLGASLTA